MVQVHVRAGAVGPQTAQVRQGGALVAGQVLDDGRRRPHGLGQVLAAEPLQGRDPEVVQQGLTGLRVGERARVEGRNGTLGRREGEPSRVLAAVLGRWGHQELRGGEAVQLQGEVREGELSGGELAGGYVDVGEARRVAVHGQGGEVVIGLGLQQGRGHHGPRGDHADHVPLHQPLGGGGVAELLADGHPVALLDEPGQDSREWAGMPARGTLRPWPMLLEVRTMSRSLDATLASSSKVS